MSFGIQGFIMAAQQQSIHESSKFDNPEGGLASGQNFATSC
jgi:hypothetical protein